MGRNAGEKITEATIHDACASYNEECGKIEKDRAGIVWAIIFALFAIALVFSFFIYPGVR